MCSSGVKPTTLHKLIIKDNMRKVNTIFVIASVLFLILTREFISVLLVLISLINWFINKEEK
jgi:hypothetical protein